MEDFENQELRNSREPAPQEPEIRDIPETENAVEAPAAPPVTEGIYTRPAESKPAVERPVILDPQPAAAAPVKPEKKKGDGKLWKAMVALGLCLGMIGGTSAITASMVEGKWQSHIDSLELNFQEKMDILQDQLNKQPDAPIVSPVEGLTPAQVYERNIASIVAVNCKVPSGVGYGVSSGSGFVMSTDGYIVTNHHVVSGASEISVTFADEREYAAKLVGSDESNDIALLKIEAVGLKAVTMGSSDALAVGSQVVAIGNALGELSYTLTAGYISGKDRDVSTDGTVINMLQMDAAINSGNSGGPLFNMKGEVVGITTAKYSGSTSTGASIEGISFAIPMDDVLGMLEDLRDYGYVTGVQMGVMVRDVDPNVSDMYGIPAGVYVESVVTGSCAFNAGIKGKDIILEVGGYEVENMNDLTRVLRKFEAGQKASVKLWRSGREVMVTIVFDAKQPS